MSIFEPVTNFLFDPKPRLTAKAAILVFIIIGVVVVDNILGYSFYYNSGKKIEQLEKVNAILRDSSADSLTKTYAQDLQKKVMERSSIIERIVPAIKGINFQMSQNNAREDGRNNFWFHLTSSGLFYLLAVLIIFTLVFSKDSFAIQDLAGITLRVIAVIAIGVLLYWIFGFIPPLSKSTWFWNYLLNFALQISAIAISAKMSQYH